MRKTPLLKKKEKVWKLIKDFIFHFLIFLSLMFLSFVLIAKLAKTDGLYFLGE